MQSCFVHQNLTFNELSHRKITNGEISPTFMTFTVSYVIAENFNKTTTLLSRRLIPLNEVFDK